MSSLTKDQVLHIAKLARLTLTPEEEQKFPTELTNILQYIDQLQEVDTKGVETTAQVTGLMSVLRSDVIDPNPIRSDDLLQTSPLPIKDHQIQTPSAHG